jgi:hypothetical protein
MSSGGQSPPTLDAINSRFLSRGGASVYSRAVSKSALFAVAATLAACSLPEAPPSPTLTTLLDVQALYAEDKEPSYRIAVDSSLPGGIPIGDLMSRDKVLTLHTTWAEGYNAAYVVTEVWSDFDEIWVQPAYVPVTGGQPLSMPWRPIFSVGPDSRFYSPYWQIVFFEVPAGVTVDSITSAEQVRDGGYPLYPDVGRVLVMTPAAVTVQALDVGSGPIPTGDREIQQGWLAGKPGDYLAFQSADLRWNEQLVVEEVPIYHFVARASDGSLVQLPIPTVAGTGPPYSNTPAPITPNPTNPPTFTSRYAGYWRLYTVVLPPEARVFAPPVRGDIAAKIGEAAPDFPLEGYSPEIEAATEPEVRLTAGKVALTPACFMGTLDDLDPTNYPQACRWLDSQQNIERYLNPALIQRTNVTVTCPFVSFRDMAVSP